LDEQNNNIDKLTDKAFSRSVVIAVVSIVMCIVCLCSATWAWFTTTTTSSENTIGSSTFGLVVTVVDGNGDLVPVTEREDGSFVCSLAGGGAVYSVTLEISEDTTATKGFCTVKRGDRSYQTSSIKVDDADSFDFNMTVEGGAAELIFTPAWGLPANAVVTRDGTLTIGE